jgi:MoaA/NifB/PqqE/SkfB family radical SAM enzyme
MNKEEVQKFAKRKIRIKALALHTSRSCNLQCRHCSTSLFQGKNENLLIISEYKKIISEAISEGVELFTIIGAGEALINSELVVEIANHIGDKAKYGLVTNGLLIKQNLPLLKSVKFDYIDISIDGIKEDHELTRGLNTYDKTKEGLRIILENKLSKKVFISSILMSYNWKNILNFLNEYITLGVRNYYFGIYVKTLINPSEWILAKEQLLEVLTLLQSQKLDFNEIIIDVHNQVDYYWDFLIEKNIICEKEILFFGDSCFYQIPNTDIFLKRSLYTTNFWNTGVITADGYYLDDYEYLSLADYPKYSIGNVKEFSFKEIINKVKEISPKKFIQKMEFLNRKL